MRGKFGLCEASLCQQLFITWYTWSGQSSGWPRCIPCVEKKEWYVTQFGLRIDSLRESSLEGVWGGRPLEGACSQASLGAV